MCQTKDLLIRQQQKHRIEKNQKSLLKLTRKTKANHCKKCFLGKQITTIQNLGKYTGND